MSENLSEDRMTAATIDRDEIADLLRRISGDSGSEAERISRAARKLGWLYGRTKRLWYGEARRVETRETEAARLAAQRAEEASTNAEIAELRLRLVRLEAAIAAFVASDGGAPGETLR